MAFEDSLTQALTDAEETHDFSGEWVNDIGSRLNLTQKEGQISGTATAVVGAQVANGDIVGYAFGSNLSLLIRWKEYEATLTLQCGLGEDSASLL